MRLTANMRLIGSSRLINGCKIRLGGTSAITGTILQAWQRVKSVSWRASFVAITSTNGSGGR